MTDLFLAVLRISLLSGVVVLIVVPLRWAFRALRLPAGLCVALWFAVLLRMVFPAGVLTSTFSLLRWTAPAIERRVDTLAAAAHREDASLPLELPEEGIPAISDTGSGTAPAAPVTPAAPSAPAVQAPAAVRPATPQEEPPGLWEVLPWVWGAGALALWGYGILSTLRLRLRLGAAVRLGEGEALRWESAAVPSPFVLGLIHPKIYVPLGLEGDTLAWVLRHERAHIRLGHHRLKPLFFAVLALHWFNPLLWLAWVLFCRDLEVQCDEQVLRNAPLRRKDYSAALLALAAPRQGLMLPPGFGETGVKDRIRRALGYRKPAKWAAVLAGILAVLCICCLAADPTYPALPQGIPDLTVQLEGGPQWTADTGLPGRAPWPEALPAAHLTTGQVNPTLDLCLTPAEGRRAPDRAACAEYLVADGQAQAPLALRTAGLNGVDGQYWLRLEPRADSSGEGMETRLIVLSCAWDSGADTLEAEYAFLVTLPSVKAGEPLAQPVLVLNGERMHWDSGRSMSAPYGSMLEITNPQDRTGFVDLYVSLEPGADDGSDIDRLALSGSTVSGSASAFGIRLKPTGVEEGQYPEQTQYYTLWYTWDDGAEEIYTFTLHGWLAPPELDLDPDTPRIRYPGQEAWTELGPLFPAPRAWAEQDLAGRDQALTLRGLLSGTGGFVDELNGWFIFSIGRGAGSADTYVYRTHDGGRTWAETGRPDPDLMGWFPACCAFVDDEIAFIAKAHFNGAEIFRTADGGLTWRQVALPLPSFAQWEARSIDFRGPDGLLVARDYSGKGGADAALISHDYGATWVKLTLPQAAYDEAGRLSLDPAAWVSAPLYVLGELPAEDITLYGLNEGVTGLPGVLLRRGDRLGYFPTAALPPLPVSADLALGDYGGDGTEQLAACLSIGSATGRPPHCRLLLFPWEDGDFSPPAELTQEDLFAQVEFAVRGRFHPEDASMTVEAGGRAWRLDLREYLRQQEGRAPDGIFPTQIYFFEVSPLGLTVYLSPGSGNREAGESLDYMAVYTASLRYDGTGIAIDGDSGSLSAPPGGALDEILPVQGDPAPPLNPAGDWETAARSMNGMDGAALMYNGGSGAYVLLLTHDYGRTWSRVEPPVPQAQDLSPEGELRIDLDNWYYDPVILLGALPEEGISLYCFGWQSGCCGLLLRRGEALTYLPDVSYAIPGPQIRPAALALADYDGDGERELAAVLPTGSGTGVSLHQLLVFEPAGDQFLFSALLGREDFASNAGVFETIPEGAIPGEVLSFDVSGGRLSASLDLCDASAPYTARYIGSLDCGLRYDGSRVELGVITYIPEITP